MHPLYPTSLANPGYQYAFSFRLDSERPERHRSQPNLVCKHWLRALCKKGDQCEFLHEYNLRGMPECTYYAKHRVCSNGDDCLYLHIDPENKRAPCPHYERGFCPLGPRCAKKHVKKEKLCPFFVVGFCPNGPLCKDGAHPKFPEDLKKPEVRIEKSKEQLDQERMERELAHEQKEEERERLRDEQDGGGGRGGRGGRGRGRWKRQGGQGRGGRNRY